MEKYEIMGDFIILFSLDSKVKDSYEIINAVQDVLKLALERDFIKVKRLTVRSIKESGK